MFSLLWELQPSASHFFKQANRAIVFNTQCKYPKRSFDQPFDTRYARPGFTFYRSFKQCKRMIELYNIVHGNAVALWTYSKGFRVWVHEIINKILKKLGKFFHIKHKARKLILHTFVNPGFSVLSFSLAPFCLFSIFPHSP